MPETKYYSISLPSCPATSMAVSGRLVCCLFVLSLLFLQLNQAEETGIAEAPSPSPSPPKIDCGKACDGRCQKSKRPNLCKRTCGSCCSRCNCVPPGTAGNHEACPCYATLKSHNGTRKQCP